MRAQWDIYLKSNVWNVPLRLGGLGRLVQGVAFCLSLEFTRGFCLDSTAKGTRPHDHKDTLLAPNEVTAVWPSGLRSCGKVAARKGLRSLSLHGAHNVWPSGLRRCGLFEHRIHQGILLGFNGERHPPPRPNGHFVCT